MSVCNLEQQVELKKSLEQYTNVLLLNEIKKKSLDYIGITKKVNDAVFTKNKDQAQSLGIAYHVPQIILNLIDANPDISVVDINGKTLEELKAFTQRIGQTDGIDYLGAKIGVLQKSLEDIEKELANQSKEVDVPIVTTSSLKDVAVDELVFPDFILKGTGQQLLEDPDSLLPSVNQTNPEKNFYYEQVLLNILNSVKGDELDFTDVTYSGHTGFRLLAMRADKLPNPKKNSYLNLTNDTVILTVVDNKGNFLYFNDKGEIVPEADGKIAYFTMEKHTKEDIEIRSNKLKNELLAEIREQVKEDESIPDSDKNAVITERSIEANKYIDKKMKLTEEQVLNIAIDVKADVPRLMDITGGKKGAYLSTDEIKDVARKKAAEKTLSEFDLTQEEKDSIQFITQKKGSQSTTIPAIHFRKYGTVVSLKNPKKLATDPEVLDNLVDVLVEDIKEFGIRLPMSDKIAYVKQFLNLENNPAAFSITESGGIVINGKQLSLENKEAAKGELRNVLSNFYVTFMKKPYSDNSYDWITISNGEVIRENKSYYDFIFKRFVPRVAMDITSNRKGRPVIVNGYFTFKPADQEFTIKEKVKQTVEEVKQDKDLQLKKLDSDDIVYRSKLIDTVPTTNAQEKRAEKFLNEHPIFNAVDENGRPLLSKDFSRSIVNSDAFASFSNAVVTLYEGASFTHGYHEAWHVFSQMYLTKAERDNLYKATAKLSGSFDVVKKSGTPGGNNFEKVTIKFSELDPTKPEDRLLLEEFIAEEFRIFAINKGKFKTKSTKSNILSKIFNRIWQLLKNLFSGPKDIYSNPEAKSVLDEMFNVLYKAKKPEDISKFMPSMEKAEFGTLNSGVINEEGKEVFTYQEAMQLSASIDGIISLATNNFINEGNELGQVRNGFVLTAITSAKNQRKIYNEIVKDAFERRLRENVDYVKKNENKVREDIINEYKKNIDLLTRALDENNFGNIADIQEGKATTNSLISFHRENTAYKDLFTQADHDIEIDEASSESMEKSKRVDNKGGNERKTEDEATKETLFLVKSLLKQEPNGKLIYNSLGFPETVDFITTWRVLTDKLGGATTIAGLYNNMIAASQMNIAPYFNQLLHKVGNPDVTMPASDAAAKLWVGLYQSFCLYKMPLMITQYTEERDEDGNLSVKIRVGRATADYYKVKKRDWPSKFAQSTSEFVITDPKTRVNSLNLPAIKKAFFKQKSYDKNGIPVYTVDKSNWIPFLNSVGLYLSDNIDIKNNLKEENVKYIIQAIGFAEANKMTIDNPIDFFSRNQKFKVTKLDGTEEKVNFNASVGAIDALASLEAQHSTIYATQMHKGASGNLKNTNALNSTYTKIINSLNEVTKKGQMFDETLSGDYQHMYYLNPQYNPQAAANTIINSLFNADGTKNLNNAIIVFDIDGAVYTTEDGETFGVPYGKMDPLDKVITDMTSMLFYGVVEATSRAGEKKSYHGIKVNDIKTYADKKSKHLYVDIEPFLRNENGDRLVNNNINIKLLNILYPKLEAELKRIKMIRDDAAYYKNYKGFEKADKFSAFADVLEQTAKKGESLKERLTTEDFLKEVSEKGLLTILRENTNLRDELNLQMLTYFKNLKERNEKHYIKSTNLSYKGEAVLPEVLIENFTSMFQDKNRYGITKEQMAALGPYTNKAIKDAVFSAYVVNTWLYHHDMGSIIHTDFFQFNHEKNEGTKRISPYQSPGNIFATDKHAKIFVDSYVKRPYEQKLIDEGVIKPKEVRKFNGKLNTAILRESKVRSAYYEMYEEMFKNAMKRRGITNQKLINEELYGKKGLDKNGNPTGGRMAPFAEIKDADGQGLITFDTYRMLKKLESDWSDAQEDAYQRIVNGENPAADELTDLFPVYKLGMAGPLAITKKYPINSIHKFSLFPLIPNVVKGKVYEDIHKKMIEQDMDYILFESGSKQSHVKSSPDSKGDEIFEMDANGMADTSRLKSDFKFTNNPIFIAYLKNQTKVNSYYKKQATLASQLRKLFNVGLYNQGKAINKRAEQKTNKVFDLIDRLTDAKKKEILRKLNWKEVKDPANPKKTILQGDMNSMLTFVKKELKKQGFPQEQIDYIDSDSNGDVDISTHPAAPQIEKLLLSIINNQIVRLKVNGEPLVEVSSAFSQDIKFKKPTKADLKTYGTNGLRSYVVDPNGKIDTKGMGVAVALSEGYQKLFYTKYFTKDEKGKYVDSGETVGVYKKNQKGVTELDFDASFDRLNEMLLVDEWLNTDKNRLKIRITGVRIPVQGPNSAEFAEIQRFLPPAAGPIIIIPAEIVAKSGTDFDVDKLTTYLKYISSRGTLFDDKYETVEELEEHIKKLESKFDKEKLKGIKTDLATVLKQKDLMWLDIKDSLSDFRSAIQDVADTKYIGKEQYNKLTSKDNVKLLETLKQDKMKEFVKKIAPEAYKIFKDRIENFNEKEYNEISNVIDNLYKQKDPLAKLALEISLAKEHKRNFSKVIENELVDAIVDVLAMPEMAEALLTPNDTHLTKYLTEDDDNEEGLKSLIQRLDDKTNFEKSIMTGERNEPKGISPTRMLEQDYNTEKQQDNISGGQGLGIVAVAGTNSNLFRMIGAKMNASIPVATSSYNNKLKKRVEEIRDVPLDMKLNYNKASNNAISLSHARDANDKNSVAEIISQLLNGFVDIGKDEWVTYLQGNPTVIPKILFLIDAGVPFEEIAYFISNPMIREYVRLEKSYGSNLSKVIYGTTHDPSKAKQTAKNELLDTIVLPKGINTEFKSNKFNMYGLRMALNHYVKDDKFSMDFLKKVAKSKLDYKDTDQKAGFLQYLILEDLIKDYDRVKMVMNPDTNTSPNLLEAKIKMNEISGLKNSPSLDPKMVEDLKNVGALRPFQVQDFALSLFGPLFPTRNHPKLVEFLLNTVGDFNERSSIEKATGLDAYKFSIKLQNSLYEYIFSNKLKKYRLGQESYNQIPVDSLINMDTVVADFNNKTYADTNAYLSRGLYPLNIAAFADSSVEEFIGFSLEREYLRRNFPIDVAKQTKEFRTKYKQLRGLERFNSLSNDSVANIAYESYLASNALKNTYNTYKLFRSGKETIANELMDIIDSYPTLSRTFPILTKFKAEVVPNDAQKKYKGYVNFTLTDKNDMDEKKTADYKKQLADLADPSVIKISNNPETNQYISNFFRYLPIYSFLQSGMNSGTFNLMEVMPNADYKRVMDSASVALKQLLDDERGMDFLKGFKELFKTIYSTKNSKILNRGANWKKSASEVIALKEKNAYNIENLSYAIEKSNNVYFIDDSLISFKEAAESKFPEAENPKAELLRTIKNANTSAVYISSLKDLVKNFPGLNFSNLENAKVSIDNALKYTKDLVDSGKTVIFTSDIFDIKPESIEEAQTIEQTKASNVEVVSPDYGVVVAETNPTKEFDQKLANAIYNDVAENAYVENGSKTSQRMWANGFMWKGNNTKKPTGKPLKVVPAQVDYNANGKLKPVSTPYFYDPLYNDGTPVAPISDLDFLKKHIEATLGIDMSDYDVSLNNIYEEGHDLFRHTDIDESNTAKNYPVIVYVFGNDHKVRFDDNGGKRAMGKMVNPKTLTLKNGNIYTFGMDGKGRFETVHDVVASPKTDANYPTLIGSDGKPTNKYTVTFTFRRAADLEPGMPTAPAKLGVQPTAQAQIPVSTEVKGNIQLELIEDLVQSGKAKTTVRRYDKPSGVYKSQSGKLYNLVNRGKVRMVADKIIGKGISYTLDEFGAAEGFDNWANFQKVAKYAGLDLMAGKEVYLYDITPAGKAQNKTRPVFDSLPGKSATPTMTYAGIGSRETPKEVLDVMTQAAKYLDGLGYTLQTGFTFKNKETGIDEEGADKAFSDGSKNKTLFGPYGIRRTINGTTAQESYDNTVTEKSNTIVKEIHPAPDRLTPGAVKLMARNTNQIFGKSLNSTVDFVLFYAKEVPGSIRPKGGTGQAVEMARRKGIPTINMADTNWREQLKAVVSGKPTTQPTVQGVRKTYSGKITSLQPNQIFVFGSNEGNSKGGAPTHGAGSAKLAKDKFGAIQGKSRGIQGQSYAIVTKKFYDVKKSSTPQEIISEIKGLYEFAKQNPNKEFLVSDYSETNLNGYTGQEMADMFSNAGPVPSNIVFNENFDKLITAKPTVQPAVATPIETAEVKTDRYKYYGTFHTIVLDEAGNGIDVENYKGKTVRKLKLLEKYNENPNMDPQNEEYFRNEPQPEPVEKLEGVSILDMRTEMIDYTSKQRKALLDIEKLIDSNKQAYYLLAGYAGTGKTTIAENIARYAKESNKDVRILAPTNKATKVLKDKFKKAKVSASASTIHKAIYGTPDPITGEWVASTEKIKDSVVIVDESSMISKELMNDLLDKTDSNNVVIFMGDGFQLEPVGQDSGLFQDKIPQIKQKSELTEVKRQSLDSNILKVATLVRTDNKGYVPETSYDDFKVTKNKAAFIQDYKESIKNNEDSVMIVATNAERILMNNIARTVKFGKDSAVLNPDDILISVANSSNYPNSETFKVTEILNTTGPMKFSIKDKMGKTATYDVYFSKVMTGDGELSTVMHIPEYDKSSLYHGQVTENASGEVLNYLNKANLINKKGRVSSDLVIATYGYAVTAHKSQGSQWSKVFVNQNYVAPTWNSARWYYTAITRAADDVVVFSSNNNTQISNQEIENKIDKLVEDSATPEKTAKLKDGKVYKASQINSKMLESMGYTPEEIGKILKQICI